MASTTMSTLRPTTATPGMTLVPIPARKVRNSILSQLPAEETAALSRYLVPVPLPLGMALSEPNRPIEFVYFVESGLISTDALTRKGEQVEIGVTGREGFASVPAVLDQPQMAHNVIVQGRGDGLRIRASVLRSEYMKGGVLQRLINTFMYLQMVQVTQSVLCNRMHEVEERLARWLLTSADRSESDTLQLTQEALSQMLGVQRSTVTVAAGDLQRRGMIGYSRGRIQLLNRPALAGVACECYGIVQAAYDRVLRRQENGQLSYTL